MAWRGVGDHLAKRKKPACGPEEESSLFRVRESSSSHSLSANINEKKLDVGKKIHSLDLWDDSILDLN